MILIAIKNYLVENKRATAIDMAYHFDVTPDVVHSMLEHWIRKGKVRRLEGNICNKGCCRVNLAYSTFYEWVEEQMPPFHSKST